VVVDQSPIPVDARRRPGYVPHPFHDHRIEPEARITCLMFSLVRRTRSVLMVSNEKTAVAEEQPSSLPSAKTVLTKKRPRFLREAAFAAAGQEHSDGSAPPLSRRKDPLAPRGNNRKPK